MASLPTPPFVLLEDSKTRNRADAGMLFTAPREIITCNNAKEVPASLEKIRKWQERGYYLAGWFSYECALAYHPTLAGKKIKQSKEPLVWFGVFEKPEQISSQNLARLFAKTGKEKPGARFEEKPVLAEGFGEFEAALNKIQAYISAGDVYQVNHTFRMNLKASGNTHTLYRRLRAAQPVPYGALIATGDWHVLSLSPELFITRKGNTLKSSPMKGTARVGVDMSGTKAAMEALSNDKKNRAENLMITDLIRNDFSRVCLAGSVKVENMFAVKRYSRVLQMTSDVIGKLKPDVSFSEIFMALFPCGSVTGAPKIRAMEIIDETEGSVRGVYTGALGYLAPDGDFTFNVPIRTIVLNKAGTGWMGIGSGIIAESGIADEYEECLLKAKFLSPDVTEFSLIETMLWEATTGYTFLDAHLARLKSSADYFEISINEKEIKDALAHLAATLTTPKQKVRLLVQSNGQFNLECLAVKPIPNGTQNIRLSQKRVQSTNPFLFHKTTNRKLYDQEKEKAGTDYYDVIFQNEKGEITEGVFNNIFIDTGKTKLLTPAKASGLLPGVFRQSLLEKGAAEEASLTCDNLRAAKKTFLGNSVSGLVKVNLKR